MGINTKREDSIVIIIASESKRYVDRVKKLRLKLHFWLLGIVILFFCGCQGWSGLTQKVAPDKLAAKTREVLLKGLNSPDPLIRVHALESLAVLKDASLYPAMRKRLDDPVAAVRFAAAIAAGDVGDRASQGQLTHLTRDENVSVKLAAGYALEKLGSPYFKNWYDAVLFGGDERLAGQACMLLGKLGNTPQRRDSKFKLWKVMRMPDQYVSVRLQAAEALARLQDKTVLKKLLIFANRVYADDRMLAISGLRHFRGPDVFAMLSVLADDPQIEVRLAAIRALGPLADVNQVQEVYEALSYEDPGGDRQATLRVRSLAILALGSVGGEKSAGRLYNIMSDKSEDANLKISAAFAAAEYLRRVQSKAAPGQQGN